MAFTFRERQKLVAPKLLNDDDDDDDVVSGSRSITRNESWILNGCCSSGSSWSALSSSPRGSELGSTETETVSDDDDDDDDGFIAELTRQMADYMLEEEDDEKPAEKCCSENLNKDLPGSPKDTVSGSDSELGFTEHHGEKLHSTQNTVPAETFQAFSDDQSRAVHFYQLENQPSVENQAFVSWGRRGKKTESTQPRGQKQRLRHPKPHQVQNRGRAAAVSPGGFWLPAMAWPPLQTNTQQQKQQAGSVSGMRAVFLGGPGSRNGSSGTGVFLPRVTGEPSEVRKKKPGCSTVLIPARVLHTLQLHFQEMNARQSQSNARPGSTSDPIQQDGGSGARSDEQHSHQKRRAQSQTDDHHHPHHEDMGLPKEWTY